MTTNTITTNGRRVTVSGATVLQTVKETLGNVLPYIPESPSRLTMRWITEVLSAADGTEHRLSNTDRPQQGVSYNYILRDEEARQARAQLFRRTDAAFSLPLWHDAHRISAAVGAGNTLTADFTDHNIANGQEVYVMPRNGERGDFRTVTSIVGSTLTVTANWSRSYQEGSYVFPVVSVQLFDGQGFSRAPVGVTDLPLQGRVTTFHPIVGSGGTVNNYQSIPLLERRPSNNDRVQESANRGLRIVEGNGLIEVYTDRPHALLPRPLIFRVAGRSDMVYWLKFLDTIRGKWKDFYLSTYRSDLIIDTPPTGGDDFLDVIESPSYETEWFDESTSHQDLQLETSQGTLQRRVLSVANNGDKTLRVNLDSPLPGGPITVSKVSLLERSRLASDEVTWSMHSAFMQVQMVVTTIGATT